MVTSSDNDVHMKFHEYLFMDMNIWQTYFSS